MSEGYGKCQRCGHQTMRKGGLCPACYGRDERPTTDKRDDDFAVNTCCLRWPHCRCQDGPTGWRRHD